jgi:hypothetical protein
LKRTKLQDAFVCAVTFKVFKESLSKIKRFNQWLGRRETLR